jgi:hypothetical protein
MNAIRWPLGDQAGRDSGPAAAVMCCAALPFAFATTIEPASEKRDGYPT